MKIQTWNIRHGGKKTEIEKIVESFILHNADTIIVTEYRDNLNGSKIKDELRKSGWIFQYSSLPPENQNGVLILSKMDFEIVPMDNSLPKAKHRWLDISFIDIDLSILGVHIPGYRDKWGKKDFWQNLLKFAKDKVDDNYIILGDFNTGLRMDCEGKMFKYSEYMEDLVNLGWLDSWRHFHGNKRDYTWYSNIGNGFRIDYAFLSKPIRNGLVDVYHSHSERIKNYSDHSALIIDLK